MDALWNAQYALAPAFAHALLDSLWQDALLALLAAASFSLLQRRSAALRHSVGMVFLLAMLLAPLLTFALFWQTPAATLGVGFLPVMSAPMISASTGIFHQESNSLAGVVSLLWLFGAALMFLRQLGGWRLIGMLDRQKFEQLPPDWQRRVHALQHALGITRTVAVRLARNVVTPFTARAFRPVIWLPLSLLTQLPAEQIEALLAHELAHICRLDWLWNGLQCVIESLLFFHPGAWWLSRRIRIEREHACDDLAVAACGDAIALAEALAALERHRLPLPHLVLAAHGGSLMQRITRLLSGPPSRARWRASAGLLVLLVSGGLLATQIDGSGNKLPNLRMTSSTNGALHPGDYRDITANGFDKQRYYRVSMDDQGRVSEIYKEDQQIKPIDGSVRAWLSDVTQLSVPPAPPPPPPPPPAPPSPPEIAQLPALPEIPPVTDSHEFKDLLRTLASDQRVASRLGNPIEVATETVHGHINLQGSNDSSGDAGFTFVLSGPKGHAKVSFSGERSEGIWNISTLDIGPVAH
jgi:beta-lactamase regulating signal transducer with metallopeptidase domain